VRTLIDEANRLDVNVSEVCEPGLADAVSKARLDKNRAAIESGNAHVEERGLSFAQYRQF
jgi:antitoxin CcdA